MSVLWVLSLFFVVFSWRVADRNPMWSTAWWLNMFASALNGVVVLRGIL